MTHFRRYLVAGVLVWLPIAVTIFLLRFLVGLFDSMLPGWLKPENLIGFDIPGLGILVTIVVLFLTGLLAANIVGRAIVGGWDALMQRIPFVRSVYSGAKGFAEVIFSDTSHAFKQVLLVEYPRKGIYSLAFKTSGDLGEVQAKTGEEVVGVFLPTTPNPTSGFIILVPKDDVTVLDMSVDDAMKMIISLGVVVPRWEAERLAEPPPGPPEGREGGRLP